MSTSKSSDIEIHRNVHLGAKLGEGGMGLVLDAFSSDLGQHLAVKLLRSEWLEDLDARRRFEEEATIMATISHPAVLPVYGLGIDDERRPFYAMKKVEGKTLRNLMSDAGEPKDSLPRRNRLLGILLDVCEAVASAHDKGIIHRDLKPENILVDPEESVYVIDWGLAKHSGNTDGSTPAMRTLDGKVMGTPGYMAPEQAEGSSARAGAEADVFALGVILYEILSGVRPFAAENMRAEMLGTIHQEPPHLRRFNFLLPRSLCEVCHKALQKKPADRYPNARGMAEDLRAYLEGRPVTAVRPNLIERLSFAARRRPLRSLAIASSVAAVAVFGAFIGVQRYMDHRLAEKALDRLELIDAELAELKSESADLASRLKSQNLTEEERARLDHELSLLDYRWILGQYEAYHLLRGVMELRFIRADSNIDPLARKRQLDVIEASIGQGRPALAESIIDTLLERNDEGRLARALSPEELLRLQRLADQAAELSGGEKN